MSKINDRINIVNKIIIAVNEYNREMVGKTFMYVFDNRYIEVIYRVKDFAHLTGVDTKLSAKDFYKEAKNRTLRHNQIYFSNRHPYDLCLKKINHLENLAKVVSSELFILEDLSTATTTYKFGLTELQFTLCIDRDLDDLGNLKSPYYIVKSLREEDCFKRSGFIHEINHIFCKSNDEKLYNIQMYTDGKVKLSDLPQSITNIIRI